MLILAVFLSLNWFSLFETLQAHLACGETWFCYSYYCLSCNAKFKFVFHQNMWLNKKTIPRVFQLLTRKFVNTAKKNALKLVKMPS